MAPNVGLNLAINAVKNGMKREDAAKLYNVELQELNNAITRELLPNLEEPKRIEKKNFDTSKIKTKPMADMAINNKEVLKNAKFESALNKIRESLPEDKKAEFDKDPVKYIKEHVNDFGIHCKPGNVGNDKGRSENIDEPLQ